jgi:hypothetical protein
MACTTPIPSTKQTYLGPLRAVVRLDKTLLSTYLTHAAIIGWRIIRSYLRSRFMSAYSAKTTRTFVELLSEEKSTSRNTAKIGSSKDSLTSVL